MTFPTPMNHLFPCLHSVASISCAVCSPPVAAVCDMPPQPWWPVPTPGPHGTLGSLLAVEWSCSPTFLPLLGEAVIDKLKDLHFTIQGLVSVSAEGAHSRQGSAGRAHSREKPQAVVQPTGMGSGTGTG